MLAPDYFGLFGLPERFELDKAALEKRYLELSREHHPDRHATAAASERLAAVQQTTDLNQAYKVLQDDFRRAEHLLRRRGVETSEAESHEARQTVDTELLVEVLELREELDKARQKKDLAAVERIAGDVQARSERAWEKLRAGFANIESARARALGDLANELTALRYYTRVLDEVERIRDEDG